LYKDRAQYLPPITESGDGALAENFIFLFFSSIRQVHHYRYHSRANDYLILPEILPYR